MPVAITQFKGMATDNSPVTSNPQFSVLDVNGGSTGLTQWRRRAGYRDSGITDSGIPHEFAMAFKTKDSRRLITMWDRDGNITAVTPTSPGEQTALALTTLASSIGSGDYAPTGVDILGHAIMSDGVNGVKVWDGFTKNATTGASEAYDAGTPAGSSNWADGTGVLKDTGSITVGSRLVRWRYYNTKANQPGEASSAVTYVIAAATPNTKLTFVMHTAGDPTVGEIPVSTEIQVDTVIIEATLSGSTATTGEFYEVGRMQNVDAATVVWDSDDTTLQANVLEYPDTGHTRPVPMRLMLEDRNRLLGIGNAVAGQGLSGTVTNADVISSYFTTGTAAGSSVIAPRTELDHSISKNYGRRTTAGPASTTDEYNYRSNFLTFSHKTLGYCGKRSIQAVRRRTSMQTAGSISVIKLNMVKKFGSTLGGNLVCILRDPFKPAAQSVLAISELVAASTLNGQSSGGTQYTTVKTVDWTNANTVVTFNFAKPIALSTLQTVHVDIESDTLYTGDNQIWMRFVESPATFRNGTVRYVDINGNPTVVPGTTTDRQQKVFQAKIDPRLIDADDPIDVGDQYDENEQDTILKDHAYISIRKGDVFFRGNPLRSVRYSSFTGLDDWGDGTNARVSVAPDAGGSIVTRTAPGGATWTRLWTSATVGKYITFADDGRQYEVKSVSSTTSLRLKDTSVTKTNASFKLHRWGLSNLGYYEKFKGTVFSFATFPIEIYGVNSSAVGDTDAHRRLAHKATVSANTLKSVSFMLRKVGSPTMNLTCQVYSNAAGVPGATFGAVSSTVAASSLTTSFAWVEFAFSTPVSVLGATYHISLDASATGSASDYVDVAINSVAGGSYVTSYFDTAAWANTTGNQAMVHVAVDTTGKTFSAQTYQLAVAGTELPTDVSTSPSTVIGKYISINSGVPILITGAHLDTGTIYLQLDGSPTTAYSRATFSIYAIRKEQILFSLEGYPQSFDPDNAIDINFRDDEASAFFRHLGDVLIMGQRECRRYAYNPDSPLTGEISELPVYRGACSNRCVVNVDGRKYILDEKGAYILDGWAITDIPGNFSLIHERIDWSQRKKFFGEYNPANNSVQWFVQYAGAKDLSTALVYNISTGSFGLASFDKGFTNATRIADGQNKDSVFLCDTSGHTWWGFSGFSDGCEPGTTMVCTVASYAEDGSGNLLLTVDDTLNTTNQGLAGVMVYWVEGDQVAEIISNTSTIITLSDPGFPVDSGPADGDTIYLGRIFGNLRTGQLSPVMMADSFDAGILFRPKRVVLNFARGNRFSRWLVRQWRNQEPAAEDNYDDPYAEYVSADNVIGFDGTWHYVNGESPEGWASIPALTEACRTLQIDVACMVPGIDYKLSAIQIESDTPGEMTKDAIG